MFAKSSNPTRASFAKAKLQRHGREIFAQFQSAQHVQPLLRLHATKDDKRSANAHRVNVERAKAGSCEHTEVTDLLWTLLNSRCIELVGRGTLKLLTQLRGLLPNGFYHPKMYPVMAWGLGTLIFMRFCDLSKSETCLLGKKGFLCRYLPWNQAGKSLGCGKSIAYHPYHPKCDT